ncbi:MAG: class I SAM-dependent RNA methyltransferase [Kiritimatiellae bacterium]|nr:class I SAM-dependent RNA methyltransferase [Kiritimatiellia bacterium]
MKIWTDKDYPIIISCAKHLVPWTEREVTEMGYEVIDKTENTVVVRGDMRDVFRLNLYLRTAHRVLVPLLRTTCRHIRELYEKVRSIDWENLFASDGYFSVSSIVHNDTIRDTRMPSLTTKDAIADRFREMTGRRPDSGPEFDRGAAVFVHWDDRRAIVYLDTSGIPLSKRGYRKIPGSAPMQETLAAACIDALKWDRKSPFISPMCGSGTPAIEAALAAIGRAPGSLRSQFAFMFLKGWNQIIPGEKAPRTAPRQRFGATPEQIWKDMVAEAAEKESTENLPPIIATDISPEAVQNARLNAHAAGVSSFITFKACDFGETPIPPLLNPSADTSRSSPNGVVFFNPEYGIRLGDPEELKPIYARIGEFLHDKCAGMTGGLITGNPDLARMVNLYYATQIPFFNGPIDCRLFVYPGCQIKGEFNPGRD